MHNAFKLSTLRVNLQQIMVGNFQRPVGLHSYRRRLRHRPLLSPPFRDVDSGLNVDITNEAVTRVG